MHYYLEKGANIHTLFNLTSFELMFLKASLALTIDEMERVKDGKS